MNIETYLSQPLLFEQELDKYFDGQKDLVIFEIGACEGEDTIKLRRKFPAATIYAFEPLPKNIQRMKRNYKQYAVDDINMYQMALSDRNGQAEFYVSSGHPENMPNTNNWDYGNKSSSLLAPKEHKKIHKWVKFNQEIKVKTQRLDSFCQDQSINRIDFIFLDVQGAELMVLEGAGNLLKNVRMIWMEVEAVELYSGQPLKNDVETFMKSRGFKCIKDSVESVAGDQLYINEKYTRPLARLKFWRI